KCKRWLDGDHSQPAPTFVVRREPRSTAPSTGKTLEQLFEEGCRCFPGQSCSMHVALDQERERQRAEAKQRAPEEHTPGWLKEHRARVREKQAERAALKVQQPPSEPTVIVRVFGEPIRVHLEAVSADCLDECANAVGMLARFAAILANYDDETSALVS